MFAQEADRLRVQWSKLSLNSSATTDFDGALSFRVNNTSKALELSTMVRFLNEGKVKRLCFPTCEEGQPEHGALAPM